jgi:YbgC/YbaW family acyl-CoA thioester hydrolase
MSTSPEPPFVWTGRIRFVDTDASTRIHYSSIFRHFEAAEDEFLRALGLPYTELGRSGLDFPRVRVECDFRSPLRYDDAYAIEVTVTRVGTTAFTLAFAMATAGKTAAAARITVVCIDPQAGRPHHLPAPLADALRKHMHVSSQGPEAGEARGDRHAD